MLIGPVIGAIIFGFIAIYLGVTLYSSARWKRPKIDIWWIPKDMQASDDKRLIMGAMAFLIFVIGLIMLIMGIQVLLRSIMRLI